MIAQQQQQWFFSTGGERIGPVGFDYLLELAKTGKLDPRADMVWSSSLNDWEPAGQVEGLFERRSLEKGANPLEASDAFANTGVHEKAIISKPVSAGTGRMGYIMGAGVVPAVLMAGWQFVVPVLARYTPEDLAVYLPMVVFPLAGLMVLVTLVKRFHNLGMTGWWFLGFAIPILNLWLGYRCLACPAGYADVKRLDGIGKFVAFLYWGSILAGIGLAVAAMVGAFGAMKESGLIEDVTRQLEELRKTAVPER
ncbi:GYF domain-containing protein [Luteolibacter marinus]|uniref:GYF domain-containing protein n=1 Tax=Luteolibacter marinus TaxID=2776705 RepID=UPI0018690C80